MVNVNTLPETQRPTDNVIKAGKHLAAYHAATIDTEIATASALGVHIWDLRVRNYSGKCMWRLYLQYDPALTPDEVRRLAWDVAVKGFGAFEPKFWKTDESENLQNMLVVSWFKGSFPAIGSFLDF